MNATPGSSKAPNTGDKMYKIDNVGRKGKGMIAAQDLSPGDVILSEKPVLIVDAEHAQASVIYKHYLDLSKDDRDRFNGLTYHATSDEITEYSKRCGKQQDKERGKLVARFYTNCMEDAGSTKRYVVVECARMNHSCNPNTTYDYFHGENLVILRALQKIARGEEILTTYVPPMWMKKRRQEKLWKDWGFNCDCEVCNSAPLMTEKVSIDLDQAHNKLCDIRNRARRAGIDVNSVNTFEQIQCCKFFVERAVSIKAMIPDTFSELKVYLGLLELTMQSASPEAKKWYGEGYRLGLICGGPNDPFVKHWADMLKTFPSAV